jgi:hypothetical protein
MLSFVGDGACFTVTKLKWETRDITKGDGKCENEESWGEG